MPKTIPLRNNNEILNNIFHLMKIKGIRQSDLAKQLGISRNAVSQWKINKSSSYMNYIDKIALLFDVPSEELLHPDKSYLHDQLLSQDEIELVTNYRQLNNDKYKKAIIDLTYTLKSCSVSEL